MANEQNLIPGSQRTPSERRKIAIMGGKASGKARRARKTLREALKAALSCTLPKTSPHYRRIKKMMEDFGIEGDPTVQDIPVLGMIAKASKSEGAFVAIRDTIGEKPVDAVEDLTPQSPVVLGMIPLDAVKREKEKREARRAKDERELGGR
jgi:hypothetical protein